MNEKLAKQKALDLCKVVNEKLGNVYYHIDEDILSLAMIPVDEILLLRLDFSHDDNIHPVNDFYKEVKEELIKLNNKSYREVCENFELQPGPGGYCCNCGYSRNNHKK
jgi:hypothetical protein